MEFIALLMPACIAMTIKQRRLAFCDKERIFVLFEYGRMVLWCNLFAIGIITYVFRISNVRSDALNSFPFFMKYVVIASVVSFVIPYISEIIRKYIKVAFYIEEK